MEKNVFFTFYDKKKNYFLNLIKPLAVRLTSLIKIHRHLSHAMQRQEASGSRVTSETVTAWHWTAAKNLSLTSW